MTTRELNKFKISVYRDFIKQKYGTKELETLDNNIRKEVTDKILTIQDPKEFVDTLTELREGTENND